MADGRFPCVRPRSLAWLADGNRAIVRINVPGTPWSEADVGMAAGHGCPVMAPKGEDAALLTELAARRAGRCHLIALIRTALGVELAREVWATPGGRAVFGNVDLTAGLGVAHDDHTTLTYARFRLIVAFALAGIAPPVDGVTTAVQDVYVLRTDLAYAQRLGRTVKPCIHPAQLPYVDEAFAPSAKGIQWARAVLDAGESVTTVDGQMADKPVLERAPRPRGGPGDAHRALTPITGPRRHRGPTARAVCALEAGGH
ncbi:aldolase/citrate lyase family protein [Streptomyces sp. NPDC097610]|uniref:HpcH/HpaI aldolase/citrate lyase family protein n=1 Tax=Streptomyces sp. NPDC097610 TaxID=3157227 RepID=UPI00332C9842